MSNETFEKKDWFTLIISKVKQNKKILIYLSLTVVIGLFIILFLEKRKNDQNIEISKEFNKAKILIENEKKEESYFILKNIINKKHKFYSPSSLYLILDFELENNQEEIIRLFDKVISISKIKDEDKDLIKIKKAIFMSNYYGEQDLLKVLNPIIESKSIWRSSALKIIIDYYSIKGDQLKVNEYKKILNNNISQ
tara:strand:+ start:2565 stop:3149 length:585 start_codon:yes stop_codon:yes gene_type:complete